MPTLEVKTVSAFQVWSSPDGQRKIYDLQLEWEGKPVQAKTYSEMIAAPGWTGTVETYEKEGRPGQPRQVFVKQPPKENAQFGQGSGPSMQGRTGGNTSGSGKFQSDPFTMYLSYAKDLAVAFINKEGDLNEELYAKVLDAVLTGGNTLYEGRPDASPKPEETVSNSTEPDLADLTAAFEGAPINLNETPWPPEN